MQDTSISEPDLYVEDVGQGPPVLLIHGNGAYADLFGPCADLLCDSHRVVSYDRRGFARSRHLSGAGVATHVDDAARLIQDRFHGPATVVGWSAGGVIALHLAAMYPQLVSGLVLAEASLLWHAPRPSLLTGLARWETARRFRGPEAGAHAFYRWVSQYRSGGNAFDRYPDEWQSTMIDNARPFFAEARPGAGAIGERLSRRKLAGIACPVVSIAGEQSVAVFPAAVRYLCRVSPNCTVIEASGAGHMIPTDAPDVVAVAVRRVTQKCGLN